MHNKSTVVPESTPSITTRGRDTGFSYKIDVSNVLALYSETPLLADTDQTTPVQQEIMGGGGQASSHTNAPRAGPQHMEAFVSSIFSRRLHANIFNHTAASKFTFVVISLNTSFQMFSGK